MGGNAMCRKIQKEPLGRKSDVPKKPDGGLWETEERKKILLNAYRGERKRDAENRKIAIPEARVVFMAHMFKCGSSGRRF